MNSRIIFYSWQADSDTRLNRSFIEDCLNRAIKKLNREDLSDLVIDRDTKNVPGMADIGNTILDKIARSAVVVADLTLINPSEVRRPDERPVSNPNVLFELGYAFGTLGPKPIIGVFNTTSGKVEELAFDLRPKRLVKYGLAPGEDETKVRKELVDKLAYAIRQSLGETEEEQNARHFQIHRILSELRLFGTEIEEWSGIQNLPNVIQNQLKAVEELPDLLAKSGSAENHRKFASEIVHRFTRAATLDLNHENWPRIKELILSADLFARTLLDYFFRGSKLDPGFHDQLVGDILKIRSDLDGHIQRLQNGELCNADLEKVSHRLRMTAFWPRVPQRPQFAAELDQISLDFRRLIIRWAKSEPKKDEQIAALAGIRDRIAQLIAKYTPA